LMVTARWTMVSPPALLKSQFQLFSLAPINPDHRLLLICHVQLMRKPDRSAASGTSGTEECARRMFSAPR
jgi:hypothetical protein